MRHPVPAYQPTRVCIRNARQRAPTRLSNNLLKYHLDRCRTRRGRGANEQQTRPFWNWSTNRKRDNAEQLCRYECRGCDSKAGAIKSASAYCTPITHNKNSLLSPLPVTIAIVLQEGVERDLDRKNKQSKPPRKTPPKLTGAVKDKRHDKIDSTIEGSPILRQGRQFQHRETRLRCVKHHASSEESLTKTQTERAHHGWIVSDIDSDAPQCKRQHNQEEEFNKITSTPCRALCF